MSCAGSRSSRSLAPIHLCLYITHLFLFTFLQRDCRWGWSFLMKLCPCLWRRRRWQQQQQQRLRRRYIRMCFGRIERVCVCAERANVSVSVIFSWFKVDRKWKCSMRVQEWETHHKPIQCDVHVNVQLKCWHEFRKMLNASVLFLRCYMLLLLFFFRVSIFLSCCFFSPSGAQRRNSSKFRCVACDACNDAMPVCMRFPIYYFSP